MPKCARHRPTAVGTAAASPGTSCCCRGSRSSGGLGEDDGKGVLGGDSVQPVESINHFLICGMQSVAEWNAAVGRVARCSLLTVPHGQLGYFSSSFAGVVVGPVVVAVVVAGLRSLDTRNEIFTSVIC